MRRVTSTTRARERQQRNVRVNNLTDAAKASYHYMIRNYPNHYAAECVVYALPGSKTLAHQHLILHHKTPAAYCDLILCTVACGWPGDVTQTAKLNEAKSHANPQAKTQTWMAKQITNQVCELLDITNNSPITHQPNSLQY